MVEESQVDLCGHSNDAEYIRGEMESLNDLVEMCLQYQHENRNVLVVLTADHECGGVAVHDGDEGDLDIPLVTWICLYLLHHKFLRLFLCKSNQKILIFLSVCHN